MHKQCQMGKMTKSSFERKTYSSYEILDLVHTDFCGHIGIQSYYGDKYFFFFVDDLIQTTDSNDLAKMLRWG